MAKVTHNGVTQEVASGRTIFEAADELALQVATSCFRTGICHECVVEITEGMDALCPRTEAESFLKGDYRLACQAAIVEDDAAVTFSTLRRKPKILTTTVDRPSELEPRVLRQGNDVLLDGIVVDTFRGHVLGLAVDLGTTTVAMDLLDLETGKSLAVSSFENPQRFGGSDIMYRISYDRDYPGELPKSIVAAINAEIEASCDRLGVTRREIYEVVVAGNSTMRDLLFRQDVQSIGQRPYKSLVEQAFLDGERETTALDMSTRRLGLRANVKARAYGAPLIASHLGADAAADLVAVDMADASGVVMVVDVGTNTEVIVGNGTRMVAASCPAGPAFEGGTIRYGMPGYDGAIESVKIAADGSFECGTIGDVPPEGICGSGLIDLLAELRRSGRMTAKGVFENKAKEILVHSESGITFSREDASNLAQAKAANYCGQMMVMRHFGVGPDEIDRLYLAGGFANYVNVRNAIDIGFLAPVPEDRIVKVGNASLQGARELLLSMSKRTSLEELIRKIEHLELETSPDFFDLFVDGCQFNPMPAQMVS